MSLSHRHLPYEIDPETNRFEFYENYWKQVGCDLLRKHLPPAGQTVLDYGCGRGEALEIFGKAGYQVTGTDADEKCVEISRRHGAATLLNVADPLGQFGVGSFDVVVCFHVLEHVENPKEVLNTFRDMARNYVLLAVPNLRVLINFFKREIDIRGCNEGHLQSWDHWHLRTLAEKHCRLALEDWGFDATILPIFNRFVPKLLGQRAAIWLETGPFLRLLPFHCNSVIALLRPVK
ncbi:MAG: methyltransferase domain-containing protein [Chthoniobacteraceae bacterium]